jgi:abortive infection bacteriophage resistance protein
MFEKEATTIHEQINLLIGRGLEIQDTDNAEHILSNISYYRLGEYWHSMQSDKTQHVFKERAFG